MNRNLTLLVAQGFGTGRLPVAPGTFGSLLGLLWTALLWSSGSLFVYLTGMLLGFGFSVWLCGAAEQLLGRRDPGSIVLDEITAMPLCFAGWLVTHYWASGTLPPIRPFLEDHWGWLLAVFTAFRIFDILKPWPVRQSQALWGGLGVTMDDLVAALYANGVWVIVWLSGRGL